MIKKIKISKQDINLRLDKWLKNNFSSLTQNFIEKNIRKKKILVNSLKKPTSYRLNFKDEVIINNYNLVSYKNLIKIKKYSISKKLKELFNRSIIYENNNFIILNKWTGIATQGGTKIKISIDHIIKNISSKYNLVHRLDKETSGLLLVTNNGDLANKLMHPKNLIPKIYEVETDLLMDTKLVAKIKKGIFIGYNQWAKAIIINQKRIKSRIKVLLQLHHGKNREIRRLFYKLNRKLYSLKRVKYGDLELGNLPIGKFRELNKIELNKVQKSLKF